MNSLSLFLDLGDNVSRDINNIKDVACIKVTTEDDLKNSEIIKNKFPDLSKKMIYNEKGIELFTKITNDINEHNEKDASRIEKVFKSKFPMITYILLAINIMMYIFPYMFGISNVILNKFCVYAPLIRNKEYYRLLTGIFLHGNILHLFFNCYALYIIGTQLESFLGKIKFLIIYLLSGISGSLFTMVLGGNIASIGASGAIFGLLGSLVYFGFHYRVYLGNVIKSQIIPLIVFNLMLGFIIPGVDNSAHIGGLIGGTLVSIGLGVKDKTTNFERINGLIVTTLFYLFMIYMAFIYTVK